MKKFLAIIILSICSLGMWATPPNLACEQIFLWSDIRTEGHEVVTKRSPGNYFRALTAAHDKQMLERVKKLVDEDARKASVMVENFKDGTNKKILNIKNNGYYINIGFRWTDDGYFHIFIQSAPEAFK